MTNYERFREDIEKLSRLGIEIAVEKIKNKIDACSGIHCGDCLFHPDDCVNEKLQWADEEYQELEVDWSKVPVDTKIWVRDSEYEQLLPRYFAKYENDEVYAWCAGATSFSAGDEVTEWRYAKLAEEE